MDWRPPSICQLILLVCLAGQLFQCAWSSSGLSSLRRAQKHVDWLRRLRTDNSNGDSDDNDDNHSTKCGTSAFKQNINDRIIGGMESAAYSWPWQISLQRRDSPTGSFYHTCGGSLVADQWVVTAAHCVKGIQAADLRVVLGEYDRARIEGHELTVELRSVAIHSGYRGQSNLWSHDIALLKLARRVAFNKYINVVCLPQDDSLDDVADCYSTGWGKDKAGVVLTRLNEVDMELYTLDQCSQRNWYGNMVTSNQLCAGHIEGGKGTCQGDSGGPLVCRSLTSSGWTLHGLVSWAKGGCAAVNFPTVFTRVGRYLDWIHSYVDLDDN